MFSDKPCQYVQRPRYQLIKPASPPPAQDRRQLLVIGIFVVKFSRDRKKSSQADPGSICTISVCQLASVRARLRAESPSWRTRRTSVPSRQRVIRAFFGPVGRSRTEGALRTLAHAPVGERASRQGSPGALDGESARAWKSAVTRRGPFSPFWLGGRSQARWWLSRNARSRETVRAQMPVAVTWDSRRDRHNKARPS